MPYTNNYSNYVTKLDDGVMRPMTVRELVFRLNELMSIDKSIGNLSVGLSGYEEGNMVYIPRFFVPNDLEGPCGRRPVEDLVGVLSDEKCDYYRVPKCVLIG